MAAAAGGDGQPLDFGVIGDVKIAVPSVVVETGAAAGQGRGGQFGDGLGQETAAGVNDFGGGIAGGVGVYPLAGAVVRQLDHPLGVGGEAVPAGAGDVGAPRREVRGAEPFRPAGAQVYQGLGHRGHQAGQFGNQARRPHSGSGDHGIGVDFGAVGGAQPGGAAGFGYDRIGAETGADFDSGGGGFGCHKGYRFPGLSPAAAGVEIPVGVAGGIPLGEAGGDGRGVQPLQRPPGGGQQVVGLALHRAGVHRAAG